MSVTPARWLTDNEDLLPRNGDALDVACGHGRHALWLAALGLTTHAVDRDADAVRLVEEVGRRRRLRVDVMDLERESVGSDRRPTI